MSGLALWIVQFAMQGKCVLEHSLGVASPHEPPAFCGYSFRDTWDPKTFWRTGLAVAYYTTLLSISMLVLYVPTPSHSIQDRSLEQALTRKPQIHRLPRPRDRTAAEATPRDRQAQQDAAGLRLPLRCRGDGDAD